MSDMENPSGKSLRKSMSERNASSISQVRKESLFGMVDPEGKGIDKSQLGELYDIVSEFAEADAQKQTMTEMKAARAKRNLKAGLAFGIIMAILLGFSVIANVVATIGLLENAKEVKTDGGQLKVAGSTQTVSVDIAQQQVPLLVAPVLSRQQLENVRTLTVTVQDYDIGYAVNETLVVSGVRSVNSTYVIFDTASGKTLHIKNGIAKLDFPPGAGPTFSLANGTTFVAKDFSRFVCAGNYECSSFTLTQSEANAMTALAVSELSKIGVNVDVTISSNRRSLRTWDTNRRSLLTWNNDVDALQQGGWFQQAGLYYNNNYNNWHSLWFQQAGTSMVTKTAAAYGISSCLCAEFTLCMFGGCNDGVLCKFANFPSAGSFSGVTTTTSIYKGTNTYAGQVDPIPLTWCYVSWAAKTCLIPDIWTSRLGSAYATSIAAFKNSPNHADFSDFYVRLARNTWSGTYLRCNIHNVGATFTNGEDGPCFPWTTPSSGMVDIDARRRLGEEHPSEEGRKLTAGCSTLGMSFRDSIIHVMSHSSCANNRAKAFSTRVADAWCDCWLGGPGITTNWVGQTGSRNEVSLAEWNCIFNGGGAGCGTQTAQQALDWVSQFANAVANGAIVNTGRRLSSKQIEELTQKDTYTEEMDTMVDMGVRRMLGTSGCPSRGSRGCHPPHATVELASGAHTRLDALSVGDSIRTPSGFEPVVGFLNADANAETTYHVFTTEADLAIAISAKHFLFVDGVEVDPATVKPGQTLTTKHGPQVIRSATKETHVGAYHLITPSGAYFVDGIAASTYVAYVPKPVWDIFGNGYASLRYKLGLPIVPEGGAPVSLFWLLDVLTAAGVPGAVQKSIFWPLIVVTTAATELAVSLGMAAPKVLVPALVAVPMVLVGRK